MLPNPLVGVTMQSRLDFCSRSLKEVEEKLRRLLSTLDAESRRTGTEALACVNEARQAVSRAQHKIDLLRSERKPAYFARSA